MPVFFSYDNQYINLDLVIEVCFNRYEGKKDEIKFSLINRDPFSLVIPHDSESALALRGWLDKNRIDIRIDKPCSGFPESSSIIDIA